ncbi:hypothetical protein C8Q79DRAFT_936246 [Trametes meyenii]|nr:hypothetical protein C8Q79DRAFT_936246 [Trametes meyenii]
MASSSTVAHLRAPGPDSKARSLSDPPPFHPTRASLRANDPTHAHNVPAPSAAGPPAGRAASPPAPAPVTAAPATPHDAVLAGLQGTPAAQAQPRGVAADALRTPPKLTAVPSVGSQERSEANASPSPGGGLRSTASSPGPGLPQEVLTDPFSGSPVGVMVPRGRADRGKEAAAASQQQFEHSREELWSRLATIRDLQSAVAAMHVQMEGTGLNDLRGAKRAAGVAGRVHSDTIHVGEDWDEPDGAAEAAEEQRKRARDAEFSDLAETFKGRRKTIDDIMGKLGELSDALTTFHALPTPVMDFATTSRNNTKDTMPISPDLVPTSPIASTAASPSPEFPSVLPKFVVSEADKNEGVFHESPVSAPGDVLPHASPP